MKISDAQNEQLQTAVNAMIHELVFLSYHIEEDDVDQALENMATVLCNLEMVKEKLLGGVMIIRIRVVKQVTEWFADSPDSCAFAGSEISPRDAAEQVADLHFGGVHNPVRRQGRLRFTAAKRGHGKDAA